MDLGSAGSGRECQPNRWPASSVPVGPVQSNISYGQAVNMIMERACTKARSWLPSDRKSADHHQSAFEDYRYLKYQSPAMVFGLAICCA